MCLKEENLFMLKQEFILLLESFWKVFSEVVNQVGYNYVLFGNKPSCCQGQYQTFHLSNLRRFLALQSYGLLDVLTCSELFHNVLSWQLYPEQQQIHACGKMPEFFVNLKNYGYSVKCLIGWQRDNHNCVEERYNQIRLNELLFWCVCNLHCIN